MTEFVIFPTGRAGDYTIPTRVASIKRFAFYSCKKLTSLIIPSSVTSIEYGAFWNSALTSVTNLATIPQSINTSENVFLGVSLGNATLTVPAGSKALYEAANIWKDFGTIVEQGGADPCATPIASGTIGDLTWTLCPDSTLTISGEGAMPDYRVEFAPWWDYYSSIGSVIIENGVTSIGSYAFYNCRSLTSIAIPNSVTSIGQQAFDGCSSLTSVTIPNSVTSIEGSAFSNCSSLIAIDVAEDNANYASENGVLFNKAKTELIRCPEGKTGTYQIPFSVISIGISAFSYCSNLTSVTIPSNVTSIGNYVFNNCRSLTVINVAEDNANYASENGVLFNKAKTELIRCPGGKTGTYQIPFSVISIGISAFSYCSNLTSVTIPNSIISIGYYAFEYCSSLTSVVIPNSVTSIERNMFQNCSSLTSVTIPSNVTSIGWFAFWACSSLTSVTNLAATPQEIDDSVFGWMSLSNVTLTVPAGAKALYEAADFWKDFGTIKETAVTVDETNPAGADGTGKFELSLTVPANVLFNGSFTLTLPNGFRLDLSRTQLSGDLSGSLTLTITQNADGSWLFAITASNLRSMTDNVYQKLVDIVYTVDESIADGNYEARIQDLSFAFDNGASIVEPEISAHITVDHSYTGIPSVVAETKVYVSGGQLHIISPVAETVEVYSVTGALLYGKQKAAGEISFPIRQVQKSVLIVRGNSGWVRKVIL